MNFLPLVARELRVASRRRLTWWMRGGCALGACLLISPALLAENWFGGTGQGMFNWMAYFAWWLCALMGPLLGADCISSERREGTLGFLFLTDLKGHDVVLGKFCSVSLSAFFGLLAAFPILALWLFAGGVTFGEFWRTCAALLNSLFFSIALALCVSAQWRGSRTPVWLALALTGSLWLGGLIGYAWAGAQPTSKPALLLSSAGSGVPFALAREVPSAGNKISFWWSLAISDASAWGLLGVAAWRVGRVVDGVDGVVWRGFFRRRRRRELLEANAVAWALDDWPALRNAAMFLGIACVLGACFGGAGNRSGAIFVVQLWIAPFCLKILFALQACRFFVEARRSGAIELLAPTLLAGKDIINGQWIVLRRYFLTPVVMLIGSGLVLVVEAQSFGNAGFDAVLTLYQLVTLFFDFLAIGWFGMWMGLSMRNPRWAAPLTIAVTVVVPMAVVCFPNVLIDIVIFAIAQSAVSRWKNPRSQPWEIEPRYDWPMIRS